MASQKYQWGYIEWAKMNEDGQNQLMNIVVAVLMPGQTQYKHIHHNEEQFLYTMEGECIHNINGKEYVMGPGTFVYMEAETVHEAANTGKVPCKHLVVSNHIPYYQQMVMDKLYNQREMNYAFNLDAAVEMIRTQLQRFFHVPITIFDHNWSIVYQSENYIEVCNEKCNFKDIQKEKSSTCLHKCVNAMEEKSDYSQFTCPNGLTIYHFPINYMGKPVGAIRSGYVPVSGSNSPSKIFDTPLAPPISIRRTIRQIIRSIVAFCDFDKIYQNMNKMENIIADGQQHRYALEQLVHTMQENVINLRINHHFLFNSLNSFADMALQNKGEELYQAIIDIASIFRYTMMTDVHFVELQDELDYLNRYINLQKIRYGDKFYYDLSVEPELKKMHVPFNFLQPILENVFVHALDDVDEKMCISVDVVCNAGLVEISVRNNRAKLSGVTLSRIRKGLKSNSGHGLPLIYAKLQSAYGDDFEMDIQSDCDVTCVSIKLPVYRKEQAL